MKFSVKLSILLLSITVSVVAIISLLAYTLNHKALEKEIHNKMQIYATGTLDTIDRTLFERIADIKVLAGDSIISSPESTPKQITARLIEYRNKYKTYASLSFFDLNRIRIADTSGMEIGTQHNLTSYWLHSLKGDIGKCEINNSESLSMPVIHFTSLVKNKNGEAFGLVVARMPISKLHDMIDPTFASHTHDDQQKPENPEGLEIDLIDADGLLLYSNYNRKGILKDNLLEHKKFKAAFAADDDTIVVIRDPFEGDNDLCVHAHERGHLDFPGSGWTMIVRLPVEVAFASVIQLKNTMAAISIAIVVVAIMVSLIFSRTISKPLTKLRNAAAEIGKGRLDTRIESTSKDEIGQLAASFNKMAEDLSKTTASRDELDAANQQLQAGQQQLKAANQQLDASNQQLQASEQQLKASNQQLRELAMIVEQTEQGIALADLEGKLRFVNTAWAKMHGYGSCEELIGKNLSIFHTEEQMKTDVIPFNNEANRTGSGRAEIGHMRKDGTAFPTEMSVTLFKDESGKPVGLIGCASDISSRKKAEEKIKVFSSAVENAYDSFVLTDTNGNVTYANKSCIKNFGYNPDEITKLNVSQFTANPEDAKKIIEELKKKGSWDGELIQVRKNKEEFPAILSTSFVKDDKGNPTAIMGIFRDVTERKQAEEMLRQAKMEAEAANEAKSLFLANISHEIRTPMNAIIGFTELLINEPLSGEQKEKLNIIKDSGQNLLSLINDILDLSKIEAGKLNTEIITCSLGQLLNFIESMMRPKAKEKGIEFKVIENSGLPAQICTDPNRLRQCLVNLTSNAIKFTEQGHVYINVSLETTDNQSNIRFDVEDTGIGVPEDRQKVIFEPFTQADGSTARKYGGTGLGLTITKKLTELLGGKLTLTSELGKGSVFSIVIPAGLDVTKQPFLDRHNIAGHWEDESDKADKMKFSGKVLVAEDDKSNQMLMKSLLEKMGLEVTIARDGNQAIQKALAHQFDLILMDIQMPYMDGYEATKALRTDGMTTPIIALTANAMGGDDKKCIEAGCDEYLAKPIERKKLFEIFDKYLSPASEEGSCSVVESIDAVKNEVDELNNTIRTTESQDDEEIIPWDRLMARGLDEQLIEEIMPTIIADNAKRLEELTSAVKKANAKNVRLYAHAIKGSAGNVGAVRLSEIASKLERMALEDDLSEAEELLQKITTEFNKLRSFVSKPDWIEIAKRGRGITDEKLNAYV